MDLFAKSAIKKNCDNSELRAAELEAVPGDDGVGGDPEISRGGR
jgi:hypothetical protein